MTGPSTTRFLHVANGTCTTRLIEAAGIPGTRSIWADPLYEGPVPGDVSDEELLAVRARYLSGDDPDAVVDPVNDLRLWRRVIARHQDYDELILWYEHDLFDQLNLIQLLSWIGERLPADKPVSLICIGSFTDYPKFQGLGELKPRELATLLGQRERVSPSHFTLAARAWQAFRSPTPEAVDQFRKEDTTILPYLGPALQRLLEEYPWTRDGLSRTERTLLRLAAEGPLVFADAFPRMHENEVAYYITDLSLMEMMRQFSSDQLPLLTPGGPAGSATLTDTGRAILAGAQDRVDTCDVDRWLGGVHLMSGADLWRWDEEAQRVMRSRS